MDDFLERLKDAVLSEFRRIIGHLAFLVFIYKFPGLLYKDLKTKTEAKGYYALFAIMGVCFLIGACGGAFALIMNIDSAIDVIGLVLCIWCMTEGILILKYNRKSYIQFMIDHCDEDS